MIGMGEGVVVADLRHHQLVADVVRAGIEKQPFFQLEDRGVEVPGDGQVRPRRPNLPQVCDIGHFVVKPLEKQYFTKR
jgi:hypothetical protein